MMNATDVEAGQIEPLLSVNEVAKLLGFSVSWVNKATAKGGIPSYKIVGSRRYRISEVEAWIESRKVS